MEEWKDVKGAPYQVSSLGRVRSCTRGTILNTRLNPLGYFQARMRAGKNGKDGWMYVHRLVAMAFVPGQSESARLVNHKDHNRQNNVASNLEWVTHTQNRAERLPCCIRVTKELARSMVEMCASGMSRIDIAKATGVSYDQAKYHCGYGERRNARKRALEACQ